MDKLEEKVDKINEEKPAVFNYRDNFSENVGNGSSQEDFVKKYIQANKNINEKNKERSDKLGK